jgi:hypothetical protein
MIEWNGVVSALAPPSMTLRGKLGCAGAVAGVDTDGEVSSATWCLEAPDA